MRFISKRTNRYYSVFLRVPADCSHGVSLSRPADDMLHHIMGASWSRGSFSGAERTQPGVGVLAFIDRNSRLPLNLNRHKHLGPRMTVDVGAFRV